MDSDASSSAMFNALVNLKKCPVSKDPRSGPFTGPKFPHVNSSEAVRQARLTINEMQYAEDKSLHAMATHMCSRLNRVELFLAHEGDHARIVKNQEKARRYFEAEDGTVEKDQATAELVSVPLNDTAPPSARSNAPLWRKDNNNTNNREKCSIM